MLRKAVSGSMELAKAGREEEAKNNPDNDVVAAVVVNKRFPNKRRVVAVVFVVNVDMVGDDDSCGSCSTFIHNGLWAVDDDAEVQRRAICWVATEKDWPSGAESKITRKTAKQLMMVRGKPLRRDRWFIVVVVAVISASSIGDRRRVRRRDWIDSFVRVSHHGKR